MIKYVQNKKIDYELLKEILKTSTEVNQFTNQGPAKSLLESHLKKIFDIPDNKTLICTSSGTAALHALYFHFKNKGCKSFVTPSYTFPSAVVGGFKTKVVDISLENHSFDIDGGIIEKNDCIIITNLFGTYPKNLEDIIQKSKKYNTKVILDNASSPTTTINGTNINCFGDASFGSLHHTKYLGFGEGGFIVIDKESEEEINNILGFGFSLKETKRIFNKHSSNFKISDVSSAAILQHIMKYDLQSHVRQQDYFINAVNDINGVNVFNHTPGVIFGTMPILYNKHIEVDKFRTNNIQAHKYYYPIRKHKNSINLYKRIINLPLHSKLTKYEIDKMIKVIRGTA